MGTWCMRLINYIEVDFYWWFMTPEMKLTEPVLRTNECCHRARRGNF